MKELYFSIDVETNGPIPGDYSMLSYGCAVFEEGNLEPIARLSENLELLPTAGADPSTMRFWDQNAVAYAATRTNVVLPKIALPKFTKDVEYISKGRKPVCVAYPAGFDYLFMYWYMMAYAGYSPFSFSCLDIKTLGFALHPELGYRGVGKRALWKYRTESPHTHVAIDDAVEQGQMFINMLKELRS